MRPRHHRHPRKDERSLFIEVTSQAISGVTKAGRLLPTIPSAANKLWAVEKKRLNPEESRKPRCARTVQTMSPTKRHQSPLKPANKGKVHRTTIKERDARCCYTTYASQYKRKRRSLRIRSQRQAEPTCDAWLGGSVIKDVALEKKKVACQAFSLSSNLFTSSMCHQS